jgi:hypothetical protein
MLKFIGACTLIWLLFWTGIAQAFFLMGAYLLSWLAML